MDSGLATADERVTQRGPPAFYLKLHKDAINTCR